MCIDICPVGALTSGAYRYKTRPWEMKHVGTVCTHCGDGCKTTLGVRRADTGMEIVRGDNRDKSGINGDFLCIKGRYAFDFANNADRIQQPLIKHDGKFVPATWEQALDLIASKFKEVLDQRRPGSDRRHRLQPHQQRRELPAAEVRARWCWAPTTSTTIAPPTSLLSLRRWLARRTPRPRCAMFPTRPRFC